MSDHLTDRALRGSALRILDCGGVLFKVLVHVVDDDDVLSVVLTCTLFRDLVFDQPRCAGTPRLRTTVASVCASAARLAWTLRVAFPRPPGWLHAWDTGTATAIAETGAKEALQWARANGCTKNNQVSSRVPHASCTTYNNVYVVDKSSRTMAGTTMPVRDMELCVVYAQFDGSHPPSAEKTTIVIPDHPDATYRGQNVLKYDRFLGSGSIGDVYLFSDAYRGEESRNISAAVKFFKAEFGETAPKEESRGLMLTDGHCDFVNGRVVPVLFDDDHRPFTYPCQPWGQDEIEIQAKVVIMNKVGPSVKQHIRNVMKLSNNQQLVRTLKDVLRLQACLHLRGVVHVDLHIGNVSFDGCNGIQLIDAGAIVPDDTEVEASCCPPIQSTYDRMVDGRNGFSFSDQRGDVAYSFFVFTLWVYKEAFGLLKSEDAMNKHAMLQKTVKRLSNDEILKIKTQEEATERYQEAVVACDTLPPPCKDWCRYALGVTTEHPVTVMQLLNHVDPETADRLRGVEATIV